MSSFDLPIALAALANDIRENGLDTRSPLAWLRTLLPLAKSSPTWSNSSDIVKLARFLSRSPRWQDLQGSDLKEYVDKLNQLLGAAREAPPPPSSATTDSAEEVLVEHHCAALKANGSRCTTIAKNAYTCGIASHVKQGAATICPGDDDTEVGTAHPDAFMCLGCGCGSDDHDEGTMHMSCVSCAGQFAVP